MHTEIAKKRNKVKTEQHQKGYTSKTKVERRNRRNKEKKAQKKAETRAGILRPMTDGDIKMRGGRTDEKRRGTDRGKGKCRYIVA